MKKTYKIGDWNQILVSSDVEKIWKELHRMVSSHPLVRFSKRAGFLVEEGRYNAYTDLTQELFFRLLSKNRFQHYLDTGMTDKGIEAEISQIELANILTAELRKRYPESYRITRRISTLVQESKSFRLVECVNDLKKYSRLVDRVYGLSNWTQKKVRRDVQEMAERVKEVPVYSRDTRMVGCTGDTQLLISNPELEKLIVKVFEAIDSPVDVRSLRTLVMSRLPIMDVCLVSIRSGGKDDGNDDENRKKDDFDIPDIRKTPEENLLQKEIRPGSSFVGDVFFQLSKSVHANPERYQRMLKILWYCYLIPDGGTQLHVSEMLEVSDSLVSDYRKRIEAILRSLPLSFEQAQDFEKALKKKIKDFLLKQEREKAAT